MKTEAEQYARRVVVAAAHRAGVPVGNIATAFGVTRGAMQRFIYQMRQEGWELPHRPGGRRSARDR